MIIWFHSWKWNKTFLLILCPSEIVRFLFGSSWVHQTWRSPMKDLQLGLRKREHARDARNSLCTISLESNILQHFKCNSQFPWPPSMGYWSVEERNLSINIILKNWFVFLFFTKLKYNQYIQPCSYHTRVNKNTYNNMKKKINTKGWPIYNNDRVYSTAEYHLQLFVRRLQWRIFFWCTIEQITESKLTCL